MLQICEACHRCLISPCTAVRLSLETLTDKSALLLDNSSNVAENIVQLVNARLDLADLVFSLGNELLLELELVLRNLRRRDLLLHLQLLLDRLKLDATSLSLLLSHDLRDSVRSARRLKRTSLSLGREPLHTLEVLQRSRELPGKLC